MDLDALATKLRAEAKADSAIVLGSDIFSNAVLENICTAFGLPVGANLTIKGLSESDIPEPDQGVLTISPGKAAVLNQSESEVGLSFTVAGDLLEVAITAKMGTLWKFSDSFTGLNVFPFAELKTSDSYFVFTTAEKARYEWPKDPDHFTIELPAGLNFLSHLTLDNFSLISSVLSKVLSTKPFKFYGPFGPLSGQSLPVGEIRAPLGLGSFGIGVAPNSLTLNNPAVAVRVERADADNPIQNIDLVVEADLKSLRFSVGIPISGSTFGISAAPLLHDESINSLIESLPGGQGFRNYIPSELSSIFAEVGLDNFTMIVDTTPLRSHSWVCRSARSNLGLLYPTS